MKKITTIIKSLRDYLKLQDWELSFKIVEDTKEVWELETADYSRFQAFLHFRKDYIEDSSDEEVVELVMHELCHIITMAPLQIFYDDTWNKDRIGQHSWTDMVNRMAFVNEQMNVKLTSIMMREFKETSEYKKLIKKLSNSSNSQ